MKVEITFSEPLLGTLSGNKEIAEEFIISKHPEGQSQEESEAIPDVDKSLEKSSTFFARTADNRPMLWDYQLKGFFKEACAAMIHTGEFTKESLKKVRLTEYLHCRTIDELIFVSPRRILLENLDGQELKFWQRPLRGKTMQGERIALARSEIAPEGTKIIVEIRTLNTNLDEFIRRWLDYGALRGLGQWRNSGCGRFIWRELKSE